MEHKKCYSCGTLLNKNSEFCPNCGKNINDLNNLLFGNSKSYIENSKISNSSENFDNVQFSRINSGSTKRSFSLSLGSFELTVILMFVITDIFAILIGSLLYKTDIAPIYKTGDLAPRLENTPIYNQAMAEVGKYHFMLWLILLILSIIQIILFQYFYRIRKVSKEKSGSYIYTISFFIIPALNLIILVYLLLFYNQINIIDHYLIKVMVYIGMGIGGIHIIYRFLVIGTGGRSEKSDVKNAI